MVTPTIPALVRARRPIDPTLVADIAERMAKGHVSVDVRAGHPAEKEWRAAVDVLEHARRLGVSVDEAVRSIREVRA